MAAPRSLLAFWAGGGSQGEEVAAQTGFRSLLAPWIGGGASGAAPVTPPGVRSMLAFWAGGGVSGVTVAPERPAWKRSDYEAARKLQRDPVWVTARLVDDDDTLSATVETIALPAVVTLGDVEVFAGLQDEPDTLTAYVGTRWPDVVMVVTPKMIRAPKMVRTPELIRS